MNIGKVMDDGRVMRALLGMNRREFVALREVIARALKRQILSKERQRAPGGGAGDVLDDVDKKLFFELFYLKVYPTFDVPGALLGKPRGRSCEAVHAWLPALEEALGHKCVLPQRRIGSVEEFRQRFPQVRDVMLDGVERPIQRPKSARRW